MTAAGLSRARFKICRRRSRLFVIVWYYELAQEYHSITTKSCIATLQIHNPQITHPHRHRLSDRATATKKDGNKSILLLTTFDIVSTVQSRVTAAGLSRARFKICRRRSRLFVIVWYYELAQEYHAVTTKSCIATLQIHNPQKTLPHRHRLSDRATATKKDGNQSVLLLTTCDIVSTA